MKRCDGKANEPILVFLVTPSTRAFHSVASGVLAHSTVAGTARPWRRVFQASHIQAQHNVRQIARCLKFACPSATPKRARTFEGDATREASSPRTTMSSTTVTEARSQRVPYVPPEIIGDIISLALPPVQASVPLQPRYNLLLTFCLVDKTWRAFSQPHFFTHVAYTNKNDRLGRLEEAVRRSEELAGLARRITRVVRLGQAFEGEAFGSQGANNLRSLRRVRTLHPYATTLWLELAEFAIWESDLDRFMGTLTIQPRVRKADLLQGLTALHVRGWSGPPAYFAGVEPLRSLERLTIATGNGYDFDDLCRAPKSTFPRLRHLGLCGDWRLEESLPPFPTLLTSSITTLVLKATAHDLQDDEVYITSLFPSLECLHIGKADDDFYDMDFLNQIDNLVAPHLKQLTLESDCATDCDILEALGKAPLASLESLNIHYYSEDESLRTASDILRAECQSRGIELAEKWWSTTERAEAGHWWWA